jgi:hypothetical protein
MAKKQYWLAVNKVEQPKQKIYYQASRDIVKLLNVERYQMKNPLWGKQFLGALLIVPQKQYHYYDETRQQMRLVRVAAILEREPEQTIKTTRSQFILAFVWTKRVIEARYLLFVQHDYNVNSQQQILSDFKQWRRLRHRLGTIMALFGQL